jgi:hypothetical protein
MSFLTNDKVVESFFLEAKGCVTIKENTKDEQGNCPLRDIAGFALSRSLRLQFSSRKKGNL